MMLKQTVIEVTVPYQYLLLCELTGDDPAVLLSEMATDLSQRYYSQDEAAQAHLEAYFKSVTQGVQHYDKATLQDVLDSLRGMTSEEDRYKMPYSEMEVDADSEQFIRQWLRCMENMKG